MGEPRRNPERSADVDPTIACPVESTPKRLAVLVDGESLFNDGVAIVIFQLALTLGASGGAFARVAFGGLAIGLVLGYIVAQIILANVDDALIERATTLALAFGVFAVAEQFHLSGILAVVAAGLMVGNLGFGNTSPTTKLTLDNFWAFLAFVANSLVFLLIGLRIEIWDFAGHLVPVFVAVAAILVSRAGVVYGLTGAHAALGARHPVPRPFRHVMYWGGQRGAISLALALSLTAERVGGQSVVDTLQLMTFGVVLFTLLVQGLSIERPIRNLGLASKPEQRVEQQRRQALVYAARAGKRELDRLRADGILADTQWQALAEVADGDVVAREEALREHLAAWPELEQEMVLRARADMLRAERGAIADAARRGLISDEVHAELIRVIDDHAAALDLIEENRGLGHPDADDRWADHVGDAGNGQSGHDGRGDDDGDDDGGNGDGEAEPQGVPR